MRISTLPDADTDMDMHAFYVACLEAGLSDLGIVSQIRLYGVRSDSTAATGIDAEAFESSETEKENYCLLRAEILLDISDLGVRHLFLRNLTSPLLVRGPHYTHVY